MLFFRLYNRDGHKLVHKRDSTGAAAAPFYHLLWFKQSFTQSSLLASGSSLTDLPLPATVQVSLPALLTDLPLGQKSGAERSVLQPEDQLRSCQKLASWASEWLD